MSQNRITPQLIVGVILAVFLGGALYLRIALPYDQVFSGDWIKFTSVDAYFHMRIVDNLVHNFPILMSFDPYQVYPGGSGVAITPLFDYILAGIIWLVGLGSPTQHTIDTVSIYFPAVLGALTIIPVYFIGKELFNRWAGIIAAGLTAILPGEFLGRSILGFTDHHVAETLFSTTSILFLILAIKAAKDREITFDHLRHRQWASIMKPLVYSLIAGIFLGFYLLAWQGPLLFVFIIFVYLVIQFIVDHLRGRSTVYLCFTGTITFIIALLMFLPISPGGMHLASLTIAIFVPIALAGLSHLIASRGIKPVLYPLTLLGLVLAGLAIFYVINPSLLQAMMRQISGIFVWPMGTTTLEMQPLLFPLGNFSLSIAWGNFTTGFFLSFISLGILTYLIIKRGEADKTLFVIWSLLILAATLSMRRFAYYFVVNVALLTGYFSWLILQLAGFKKTAATVPVETPKRMKKKDKQKKRQKDGSRLTLRQAKMALGVIAVFFLAFFPNINTAINTASQARFAPSNAWYESLSWLKDNTPDPFDEPAFYNELYEAPPKGESYNYPETAYGVTAWWDYGYWITRIGHRIPNCNPGGGLRGTVAQFFTAGDETSAGKIIDEMGSKYIVIDYPTSVTKFHAIAKYAGSSKENFYDIYYLQQDDKLVQIYLFYPEYYHSLVARLYNFDGNEVTPQSSTVIAYKEGFSREGVPYKEITSSQSFDTYEEAEAYVSSQESDKYRIVSSSPFVSPVPLEALEHYKLIYSSKGLTKQPNTDPIPSVKIFEYIK